MSIDIKDFYLKTPMTRYEYFRMKFDLFPADIIKEYELRNKVSTVTSTVKSVAACMDYHKPASSHKNC